MHPNYLSFRLRRMIPLFKMPFARQVDHAVLTALPFLKHVAGSVLIYVEK
jgi:hypothetical protein